MHYAIVIQFITAAKLGVFLQRGLQKGLPLSIVHSINGAEILEFISLNIDNDSIKFA